MVGNNKHNKNDNKGFLNDRSRSKCEFPVFFVAGAPGRPKNGGLHAQSERIFDFFAFLCYLDVYAPN